MFSYLLYIIPLGDRSSDLKKKLESCESHGVVANLLSESRDGICFNIVTSESVRLEDLVWKTLRESAIPKGSYWEVFCGRNITQEMREQLDKERIEKEQQLQIDEMNKLIIKEEESSLVKIKNMHGINLSTTETTWRFL